MNQSPENNGTLAVPWQHGLKGYRTLAFKTHMEVQSTEGDLVLGFISRPSVDMYTAISELSISASCAPCARRAPPYGFKFLLIRYAAVVKLDRKTTPTMK